MFLTADDAAAARNDEDAVIGASSCQHLPTQTKTGLQDEGSDIQHAEHEAQKRANSWADVARAASISELPTDVRRNLDAAKNTIKVNGDGSRAERAMCMGPKTGRR